MCNFLFITGIGFAMTIIAYQRHIIAFNGGILCQYHAASAGLQWCCLWCRVLFRFNLANVLLKCANTKLHIPVVPVQNPTVVTWEEEKEPGVLLAVMCMYFSAHIVYTWHYSTRSPQQEKAFPHNARNHSSWREITTTLHFIHSRG